MPPIFYTSVEVLLLIILIIGLQVLLGGFGLVGDGVSIRDTHTMNTILPLHPQVPYQETPFSPPSSGGGASLTLTLDLAFPPRT